MDAWEKIDQFLALSDGQLWRLSKAIGMSKGYLNNCREGRHSANYDAASRISMILCATGIIDDDEASRYKFILSLQNPGVAV